MKLNEITKSQVQAAEEAKQKRLDNHAIGTMTDSYKNGHISYEKALKHLTHHGLSIEQAKQQLMVTGPDVDVNPVNP